MAHESGDAQNAVSVFVTVVAIFGDDGNQLVAGCCFHCAGEDLGLVSFYVDFHNRRS
jgi:hypothetical protein